ncbi:MAG: twin-arginine translocation signal domain-containing protein, partial [Gemmatimonadales bacterium]
MPSRGGGRRVSEDRKDRWVRVADNRWRRLSRREFLKIAATGAAAASLW